MKFKHLFTTRWWNINIHYRSYITSSPSGGGGWGGWSTNMGMGEGGAVTALLRKKGWDASSDDIQLHPFYNWFQSITLKNRLTKIWLRLISEPSKSCAIVQRISDSNSSVIFRLILDDSESSQEVYVFMRHSCFPQWSLLKRKVHLNLKNTSLQHGFSDDGMETRLPVELNIQMGGNYRTASNRTEGSSKSCVKDLVWIANVPRDAFSVLEHTH